MNKFKRTNLNPALKGEDANNLFTKLKERVVGQDEALEKVSDIIQSYKAGLNQKGRPLANVMFLGPSGSGKTHSIEAVAYALFGNENAFFKMDCGEFQNSASTATLIGAAPGYLGYDKGAAYLSQEKLDKYQTEEHPFNLFLCDEIEKAHEVIYRLLLGVLDKGKLTTNKGEIDFSNTIIFMTSNLGSGEVLNDKSNLGFSVGSAKKLYPEIKKAALRCLDKQFSPEFINRFDHTVVYNVLTTEAIDKIYNLELNKVRDRIFTSNSHIKYTFVCTDRAKEIILKEGYSPRFGARELKRSINKYVTNPLASLMLSKQINFGDIAIIYELGGQIAYEKLDATEMNYEENIDWDFIKSQLPSINDNSIVEEKDVNLLVTDTSTC